MAVVEAGKEIIWVKDLIGELRIQQDEIQLYYHNQSVIHLAKNVAYHSRTKHIQRRYHWLRERIEDKDIALTKVHTEERVGHVDQGVVSRQAGREPETDQIDREPHVGVKGEFVGKPVPPDGKQTTLEKKTRPDGSGRNPTGSAVNQKEEHICNYVQMRLLRLYL